MEAVFRALADPTRRMLLDRLFSRDGQTLQQLCESASMTRFGVMKHLTVLEDAGLVVSRRAGREKLHYLNPMPIRLVADRWISKYAAPWAGALATLKAALEEPAVTTPPAHIYELFIRTTPEKLWQAITDPTLSRQYFYNSTVESSWQPGASVRWLNDKNEDLITGTLLEVDPPNRLVQTFAFTSAETAADKPSRLTWLIERQGAVCKLTLTHEFEEESASYRGVRFGWNPVLSGLKTLLETGEPLIIGA
jgi:uncharacterized protein YndB with AHSA1/START domain/DNA-binding transcriptional ArsR family regulator